MEEEGGGIYDPHAHERAVYLSGAGVEPTREGPGARATALCTVTSGGEGTLTTPSKDSHTQTGEREIKSDENNREILKRAPREANETM